MAKNASVRVASGEWHGNVNALPVQATALTATGTNQATGFSIVNGTEAAMFGTVAASTAALLPKGAQPSDELFIVNGGANALLLFPQVGGAISGLAANASISIAVGKSAHAYALTSLNWVVVVSA